jgi:hypothetical protein
MNKIVYKLKDREEVEFKGAVQIFNERILVVSKFSTPVNKNKFEYFLLNGHNILVEKTEEKPKVKTKTKIKKEV